MSSIRVIDKAGNDRDLAWVAAKYGLVTKREPAAKSCYRVVELREVDGILAFQLTLLDPEGLPVRSQKAIYHWPGAPAQPGSGWDASGQVEITNTLGTAEHTAGAGEGYFPPDKGPVSWWAFGSPEISEVIEGLGWLGGTNHEHLQVTMQWFDEGEEPPEPPEPPAGDLEAACAALFGDLHVAFQTAAQSLIGGSATAEIPPSPTPPQLPDLVCQAIAKCQRITADAQALAQLLALIRQALKITCAGPTK